MDPQLTRRQLRPLTFYQACGLPWCELATPHVHFVSTRSYCPVCGRGLWSDGTCVKQGDHDREQRPVTP